MKSKDFYKNTAWKWFSKYVLLHHSNNGTNKCATCGTIKACNDPKIHLGHLIKVFEGGGNTNFATAFDERNVLPQCYQCNVKQGGRELKMMEAVNNLFGKGTYDQLKLKSRFPHKLGKVDLKYLSDTYRTAFNGLVKTKGNPWKK